MRLAFRRRLLSLLCVLLLVSAVAQAEVYDELPREDWYSRPLLRLTAFNTAQSDCLLLECGGQSMMVDGGTASFREKLKNALEERGITRLKYLLNTHFHEDHISGLYYLMRYGFEVGLYLHPYNDYAVNVSSLQKDTMQQAARSGVPTLQVFHGDQFLLGEAVLTLYRYDDGLSTNGRSVVTHVTFGDASILLTGDIIGDTQTWLVKNLPAQALKADIVKAPHHAITPMTVPFLEAVDPEAVLITNDYDRVDKGRVQLDSRDIPAFYSGEGTVVFETDGDDWYIYQLDGAF